MSDQFLDRLLELDFERLWITVFGVLQDPSSNIIMFALLVGGITLIVLIIVLILIVTLAMGDDDDEYLDLDDEDSVPTERAPAPVEAPEPPVARTPLARAIASALWLLALAVVWFAGGYASSRDAICESCHLNGGVHVTRVEDPARDPHAPTRCVECHETSNKIEVVTIAVPARAVHMLGGAVSTATAGGYGVPIKNRSCAGCHEAALDGLVEDRERGIRMSHKEPLEARALCSDCHALHEGTGVVDRYIVGMGPCLRCHDEVAASAECSVCHTRDVGYAVQASAVVKASEQIKDVDCGGCHSQKACDACHGIRMPHSIAFKGPMHARAATEDVWYNGGKMCKRCHSATRNPCQKCHTGSSPGHPINYMIRSHKDVDPYNNGCGNCHDKMAWIVGRNFCGNCHPQYGPSIYNSSGRKK